MAVMFAVGAMSLTWMALLTLFMFAEKILPKGQKLAIPIASFLCVMGIWIAVSPGTAPLLKDPMMFASICRGL
jgi:predicted metal-binding membrane protein